MTNLVFLLLIRCSHIGDEEFDDLSLDDYSHSTGLAQEVEAKDGQSGEQSPLLLHQGGIQEPLLYSQTPLNTFNHIDEDDSENDISVQNCPADSNVVSERLKLLPNKLETNPRLRRPAGSTFGVSVSPPPEGSDQLDYTVMSPTSLNTDRSHPLLPTDSAQSTQATAALPVLEVDGMVQGGGDASFDSRRPLKNNVLTPKSRIDELASLLASHKSSTSSDPTASDLSASESGSKESSSSSGSHHFNGPTANGHGPYSRQQTALC